MASFSVIENLAEHCAHARGGSSKIAGEIGILPSFLCIPLFGLSICEFWYPEIQAELTTKMIATLGYDTRGMIC